MSYKIGQKAYFNIFTEKKLNLLQIVSLSLFSNI